MASFLDDSTVANSKPDSSEERQIKRIEAEQATKIRLFEWSAKEKLIELNYSLHVPSAQINPHNEDFMFATIDETQYKNYLFYFRNTGEHEYEFIIAHYLEHNISNLSVMGGQRKKFIKASKMRTLINLTLQSAKIVFYDFNINEKFMTMFEPYRENLSISHYCFYGDCSVNGNQLAALNKWNMNQLEFHAEIEISDRILRNLSYRSLNVDSNVYGSITDRIFLHWLNHNTPNTLIINRITEFTVSGIVGFIKTVVTRESEWNEDYSYTFTVSKENKHKIESILRSSKNLLVELNNESQLVVSEKMITANDRDCTKKVYLLLVESVNTGIVNERLQQHKPEYSSSEWSYNSEVDRIHEMRRKKDAPVDATGSDGSDNASLYSFVSGSKPVDKVLVPNNWGIKQLELHAGMVISDKILREQLYRSLTVDAYVYGTVTNRIFLHWLNHNTPNEIRINKITEFSVSGIVGFIKSVVARESDQDYSWSFTVTRQNKTRIQEILLSSKDLVVESNGEDELAISKKMISAAEQDCSKKVYLRLMEGTGVKVDIERLEQSKPEDSISEWSDNESAKSDDKFHDLVEIRVHKIQRNKAASVDQIVDADHVIRTAKQVKRVAKVAAATVPPATASCSCGRIGLVIGFCTIILGAFTAFAVSIDIE